MTDDIVGAQTLDRRELLRHALEALEKMKKKLEAFEQARREPIAVIGMGCRLPGGVKTPEQYWDLLARGGDAITRMPEHRWNPEGQQVPGTAGAVNFPAPWGGFLEDIDRFDASFFGISGREAESMDPQQRLLLEVAWEAIERACIDASALRGSKTGVFVGVTTTDYSHIALNQDPTLLDAYTATGSALNVTAGRIAYVLGLNGPAMAIDTACSSSLVAIHLACQSLRLGEADMALAGGVNALLKPEPFICFSKWGMMAPDGRCKTFDAAADGFVRSEGCGLLLLKRLSDAEKSGDPILAVIRGSAVNQDGASSGLTVPNGPAQEAVIRKALESAGLAPDAIGYVEAHGTGTRLGDPIELEALVNVLGKGRSARNPLRVGAVKTNIGHLESASGVAGVIKVILALQHHAIPPHLHFSKLSPQIQIGDTPVEIPTTMVPWDSSRLAGVSSFGFSGTNAHVILEGVAPNEVAVADTARPLHLLALSAKTPEALAELARCYYAYLGDREDDSAGDACFTANTGRVHFKQRLAVSGDSPADLAHKLRAFDAGDLQGVILHGEVPINRSPGIAFLFTGQGSQYVGMGRVLYETQPSFRKTLERCDAILRQELERPLLSVLYPEPDRTDEARRLLDQTGYAQPALFALEYALAELWRSWGIEPAAVMGHSVGEYVAACVAGVFGLEDGLRLIAARGRLMQALPQGGAMAALFTDEQTAIAAIEAHAGAVSLAALNGPANTVISGAAPEVEAIRQALQQRGIGSVRLNVSHAFHSPLMEPILDEFERIAASVRHTKPQIDLLSNVTGERIRDNEIDAGYWRRHVRLPVRFMQMIRSLHAIDYRWFVEAGPHPVLCGMAAKIGQLPNLVWLPSLGKGTDDWTRLLESLGQLYVRGAWVDWRGFDRDFQRSRTLLPTYPFQRKRYWVPMAVRSESDPGRTENSASSQHAGASMALNGAYDPSHWFYGVEWRPADSVPDPEERSARGVWLILADRNGVGNQLRERLEALGAICAMAVPGSAFRNLPQRCWEIVPDRPDHFRRLLDEAEASSRALICGIIHLWGLDLEAPGNGGGDQALGCGSVLNLLKELSALGRMPSARLWLVTRGAQAVDACKNRLAVQQATLWGMGRVIALEMPRLWGGLIDLAPEDPLEQAELLVREILAGGKEDQIAFRNSRRFVARLNAIQLSTTSAQAPGLKPEGTYLITGGLGGLGFSVARWVVEKGARHLLLTGRSGPSESVGNEIARWTRLGVRVEFVRADVADFGQIESAIEPMLASMPPLNGIVHAAGVIDDGVLLNQDWQRFAAVMAPKVQGAWNLHVLSQRQPLDFFVLFSSMASLLGSSGQANYAAGNAFLDALAHYRRAEGLPAVSINWGPWSQIGMAAAMHRKESDRRTAFGIGSIAPDQGLSILERILTSEAAQIGVLPVDWSKLLEQYPLGCEPPLLRGFAQEQRSATKPPSEAGEHLLRILDAGSRQEREEHLCNHIRRQVIRVLKLDPAQPPDLHQNLAEVGMDSLMAVELNQRLRTDLGRALPSTLAFEYPTIQMLTRFIIDEVLQIHTGEESTEAVWATTLAGGLISPELERLTEEEAGKELLKALERKGY